MKKQIKQLKQLTVEIDGLAQLTKELKPVSSESDIDIRGNKKGEDLLKYLEDKKYFNVNSKEIEKAVDSLYLAKAWSEQLLSWLNIKTYTVIESEGFGVLESPMQEKFRKTFNTREEAEEFLDSYRKDKNLSWANWETPYTYKIKEDNIQEITDVNTNLDYLNWKEEKPHIEKVDWLRGSIEQTLLAIRFIGELPLSGSVYFDTFVNNITTHLSEARFWLGFELERLKNEN